MKPPPIRRRFASARRQRGGAVLYSTMILLLIGLVIGAAVGRGAFVQSKVASNFYDRQIAFQVAQAALRVGETKVQDSVGGSGVFRDCTASAPRPCPPNPFTDDTSQINDVSTKDFDFSPNPGAQTDNPPQYVVEYLGNFPVAASEADAPSTLSVKSVGSSYGVHGGGVARADFYRITARSSAPGDGRASVTLQSIMYQR